MQCLISSEVDYDNNDKKAPNPGLVDFAISKNILHSQYSGKRMLYNTVYHRLNQIDKVAFFIFSIYRWLSDDRAANLSVHPHKEMFYAFAETLLDDKKFISYISKRKGEDLR